MIATTGSVIRNSEGDYEFDGKKFPSVTTILGTIEEVGLDKGLGYIFGTWTAQEATRIFKALLAGDDFMRPAGWVLEQGNYVKAHEPINIPEWVMSGGARKVPFKSRGKAVELRGRSRNSLPSCGRMSR